MHIFLSYRHADSSYALWLYPSLIQWFGPEDVFWDRKSIQAGAVFADVIGRHIRSSKAFVALVSHSWLFATDSQSRRSIDSPDDWIRRETALALQEGVLVIPVLVGGMQVPRADELPEDLRALVQLQMLSMEDLLFHDHLRERLETVIPRGTVMPDPDSEGSTRLQRRAASLLRGQIQRLQVRAVELIQDGKVDRATEELNQGSELLMAVLDLLVGDPTLDAQLAYLFGTTSQSFARAGDRVQSAGYRELALSVFRRLQDDPALPAGVKASAIKGIGGAHYENGDPVAAIEYYRSALEIAPGYSYAWHDLFAAYDLLARRGAIHLAGMREAIDKARESGAGQPGLSQDTFDSFEHRFLQWQRQLAGDPHRQATDGVVHLVPRLLVLVVTEADPTAAIFNLNCDIVHVIADNPILRVLDATVTLPDGRALPFHWTVFYDFQTSVPVWGAKMTSLGPAHELPIAAGRSTLGVQFAGPLAQAGALGSTGRYQVDLHGWASKELHAEPFAISATFWFDIGDFEASEVSAWALAPRASWDELADPDRAVGIPIVPLMNPPGTPG